jgi:hypothetical protein
MKSFLEGERLDFAIGKIVIHKLDPLVLDNPLIQQVLKVGFARSRSHNIVNVESQSLSTWESPSPRYSPLPSRTSQVINQLV